MGILSVTTVEDLQNYVLEGNVKALQKLPGIGKKTAERLILELKDKITKLGIPLRSSAAVEKSMIKQEVLSALITLGYSRINAEKAIHRAMDDISSKEASAEELIRISLKYAMM